MKCPICTVEQDEALTHISVKVGDSVIVDSDACDDCVQQFTVTNQSNLQLRKTAGPVQQKLRVQRKADLALLASYAQQPQSK